MLRPEERSTFRQARATQAKRWQALVADAERYLSEPLMPEPKPWTDNKWNAEEWRANFVATTRAVETA
jgi:hypothetical protein